MAFNIGGAGGAASIALDSARAFSSGRSRGALGSMRSYQDSAIRKGRLGYPKRLPPAKIGLSNNSRSIMNSTSNALIIGGDALFATQLDFSLSIDAMQTQIKALRAQYLKKGADRIAEHLRPDYDPKGSKVDTKA